MARIFQPPWGASAFSAIVSIAAGVAILGFGVSPVILVPLSWATATGYFAMKPWINRRLGRQ